MFCATKSLWAFLMPEAFFVSIFHLYSFDWKFDVENCLLLWHKLIKKHSKDLMKEIECF